MTVLQLIGKVNQRIAQGHYQRPKCAYAKNVTNALARNIAQDRGEVKSRLWTYWLNQRAVSLYYQSYNLIVILNKTDF
jgi:hypothetical protein